MIPSSPVGLREVMALTPVGGATYSTLARNAQHVACDRGRIAVQCYGPTSRRPLHLMSPSVISIPLIATPHEHVYDLKIAVAAFHRQRQEIHWTATIRDLDSGAHSTTSQQQTIGLPGGRVDDGGYMGRALQGIRQVGTDPWWGQAFDAVIWSDWIRHECDASLERERELVISVTRPPDLPATYFWGAVAIGYDDRELVGTIPADGSGIGLSAWGTYPGPSPYYLQPTRDVLQEHIRGLVAAGHYHCAYMGRGHVGMVFGIDENGDGAARSTNPGTWTEVGRIPIVQRKHITGVRVAVMTDSDSGGQVRIECPELGTALDITTGAGGASASDTFYMARGDQDSTLVVQVKTDGLMGDYHDLLGLAIVDEDMTEAEIQALV